MPELLNTIGTEAFYRCESLTALTLSDALNTIDKNAFSQCTSLSELYFKGTMRTWEQICINYGGYPVSRCTVCCTDGDYWMG